MFHFIYLYWSRVHRKFTLFHQESKIELSLLWQAHKMAAIYSPVNREWKIQTIGEILIQELNLQASLAARSCFLPLLFTSAIKPFTPFPPCDLLFQSLTLLAGHQSSPLSEFLRLIPQACRLMTPWGGSNTLCMTVFKCKQCTNLATH